MSTVERKEYQQTQVMRTVSPVRSSQQNLSKFDSKLDYLLEDLQNSVSRPGSSLGQTSSRNNTLSRVQNVKSSNPVTEYSSDDAYSYSSPDGRQHVSGYKKESYSYKTSGGGTLDHNQLDSLLDDLQQVKQTESYNNNSIVGREPNSRRTVSRELHYGDTPRSSSRSRTVEQRNAQYTNEGTYGNLRTASPSPSRTSTLTKQTKVANIRDYPVEVVETVVPDIDPEVLAHLDPNLRPPGNTKVTTTIKTYTYEIPGSGNYPTNLEASTTSNLDEKYVYSPNDSRTSQTTPSRSFVYSKTDKELTETNKTYHDYPPYQKPAPPMITETVTRNYQPRYSPDLSPPNRQTYVYNESTTTRNGYPPYSDSPPRRDTYYTKEMSSSTTNRTTGGRKTPTEVETFDPKLGPGYGSEPVNIHYKYKSTTNTSNNYRGGPGGYPQESQVLLPNRFPTTRDEIDSEPPKRVDDLMATLGREPATGPLNAGYLAAEQQKKVDESQQRKEKEVVPVQYSKNISGPPVYYPPGHEMFAKKEEEGGAWRAQGGYEKASGKYEYEAKSKSKSKSSGGATVVPLCLPLCCGLPCVIL